MTGDFLREFYRVSGIEAELIIVATGSILSNNFDIDNNNPFSPASS
jgi:hypothetical protein